MKESPMTVLLDSLLPAYVYAESAWVAGRHRTRRARPARPARPAGPARSALAGEDRGEGVISAALAVLIMAFIGALMWGAYEAIWDTAKQNTEDKVNEIGT
jgi:hypothetical protein